MKFKELERARDSYLKLHASMEMTEKKQKEQEDDYNRSCSEAKQTLLTIEKDIKKKSDVYSHTLDKIKEKC